MPLTGRTASRMGIANGVAGIQAETKPEDVMPFMEGMTVRVERRDITFRGHVCPSAIRTLIHKEIKKDASDYRCAPYWPGRIQT